jgi:protoheme IX farnesyltransferase
MKYRDEYGAAGVPMLPVVKKPMVVAVQIILYTWAMVVSSLLLIPLAKMGWIYAGVALLSGAWFLVEAYRLYSESKLSEPKRPMRLFHGSITYLTLLFIAIAIDPLIRF